jgi:arylsulfatase A-like enzyme
MILDPPGWRGLARFAGLAAALFALACGARERASPPDILLVSIDTLRADHLGCYGSTVPTSPNIDRFRREAVLFRTVIAQAPSTLASHASLLTSQLPAHHGASFASLRPLPDSAVTLAEVLAQAGYRTLAVTGRGQLDPRFGIGQGFETYAASAESPRPGAFSRAVRRALGMLDRPDARPTFLFLHTYEVHHPYTPDPKILARLDPDYLGELGTSIETDELDAFNSGQKHPASADARRIERAYDAEIVSVDEAFGRLLADLRERGRLERTVVVLTSDHGEEFGERGFVGKHSHTLYDELLRVPLLVRLPGGERGGGEVELPVRSLDIAPTVLAVAGVAIPSSFDGRSLVPLVRGETLRELPAIAQLDDKGPPDRERSAIRWQRWKLNDGRLFDLRYEPGERFDRAAIEPRRVEEYRRLLQAAVGRRHADQAGATFIDRELERELEALGYLR